MADWPTASNWWSPASSASSPACWCRRCKRRRKRAPRRRPEVRNMAKFFIGRPVFAIVIALLIMLAGGLALSTLPIEQFPPVAPPTIQIAATYPGASAGTVQDTVVQPIEQQMSGIDHLLYLSSSSDDTGQSTTTLTFAGGTDPDVAQVQVQNKLALAVPRLPAPVQQAGLRVTKASSSFLLVLGVVSTDGSMSKYDIADFLVSHLQDPLSRIDGVGDMNVFGTQFAMRVWLDPVKLNSYALTPPDVIAALQAQNVQTSGGQLGAMPSVPGSPSARRCAPRRCCARPTTSATSCSRPAATARRCTCATWPASRWAAKITTSTSATTASRRPASASCWRRAPTRCAPRSASWRPSSPKACRWCTRTTPRPSCASRSAKWSRRCWRG